MPPAYSNPAASSAKQQSAKNLEVEEILQAVVLTDNFNEKFAPLNLERSSCLIPLANVPLLEYTLEFLDVTGVSDIIIICGQHYRAVQEYIDNSKWRKSLVGPKIQVLVADCKNTGDALRELDAKQLIKSDFILVSGDIVTNMHLDRALEMHKLRRHADSSVVMTMVVRQASLAHRTRSIGQKSFYVLDALNHECLSFESSGPFCQQSLQATLPAAKKRIELDTSELLKHRSEIQLRSDLIDCQIDICSPEVLALFTENFDYGDLRSDFLKSILESDLLERKIFCHIISDEYAARVDTPQMYDAVSRDLLGRWTFPLVPDSNLAESTKYKLQRGNVVKDPSVVLSRSASVGKNVIIGPGTTIGDRAVVRNCVIGRNCDIGSNVMLTNAFIWDNVVIRSNCTVDGAIICENVVVEDHCTVEKGAILSYNTRVGPRITIKSFTRLSMCRSTSQSNSQGGIRKSSISFPSSSQRAAQMPTPHSAPLHPLTAGGRRLSKASSVDYSLGNVSTTNSSTSVTTSSSELSEADDGGAPPTLVEKVSYDKALVGEKGCGYLWLPDQEIENSIKVTSIGYTESEGSNDNLSESGFDSDEELELKAQSDDEEELLPREIVATIHRAVEQGHSADTAVLELNTLKMAFNATFSDIRRSVYPTLIDTVDPTKGKLGVKAMMDNWSELFQRYTFNEDDQLETMRIFESHILSKQNVEQWSNVMLHFLFYLYDCDVVEEDTIFTWYSSGCGLTSSALTTATGSATGVQSVMGANEKVEVPAANLLQQQFSQLSFKTNPNTLTEAERYIREKVKSFVTWLNEAETFSEEEDDDDDAEEESTGTSSEEEDD